MAAAYHHGTETIRIDAGSSPVYTVDGAITALVGTAPTGKVNELTVCQTAKDFAAFGGQLTGAGFTLPDAANIWTRYGSGVAYVINVCDPDKHKSSVTDEALTVDTATLRANIEAHYAGWDDSASAIRRPRGAGGGRRGGCGVTLFCLLTEVLRSRYNIKVTRTIVGELPLHCMP